jgi:hypothetical protein
MFFKTMKLGGQKIPNKWLRPGVRAFSPLRQVWRFR